MRDRRSTDDLSPHLVWHIRLPAYLEILELDFHVTIAVSFEYKPRLQHLVQLCLTLKTPALPIHGLCISIYPTTRFRTLTRPPGEAKMAA